MIFDAHVHMGYYRRKGHRELFYYSPRRIAGVLNRSGVREFIVSSTTAQFAGVAYSDLLREAEEMKRISKGRAHIFFWLTEPLLRCNPNLDFLDTGLYDGVKFHELVTPWFSKMKNCFLEILAELEKRHVPVQLHTGKHVGCNPAELEVLAVDFPKLKMDFAHFFPADVMLGILSRRENVFTDVAMYIPELYAKVPSLKNNACEKIMFGSDFPAYHDVVSGSFARCYRRNVENYREIVGVNADKMSFMNFLSSDTVLRHRVNISVG